MHRYLSADITCSKMRVVFRVRSARKTVSLKEHIMSINKFESIFLRKIEAIVFIISQLFFRTRKKMVKNRLLFAAWDVSFFVSSGSTLLKKQMFPLLL